MERFWLRARLQISLINLSQNFVIDGPPTVIFKSHVPPIMIITFRFVVMNVDSLFASFLFHLHVVTWSERIDIYNTSMTKDLIVD